MWIEFILDGKGTSGFHHDVEGHFVPELDKKDMLVDQFKAFLDSSHMVEDGTLFLAIVHEGYPECKRCEEQLSRIPHMTTKGETR